MAHGTRINGTSYGITGGKCLVNGTAYSIKKGRTLISGTGYEILFSKPTEVFVNLPYGLPFMGVLEVGGSGYTGGPVVERLTFQVGETVLLYVQSDRNGIRVNGSDISFDPFEQDITGKNCTVYYNGGILDPLEVTIE